jgi:2'-5' RNA ligase
MATSLLIKVEADAETNETILKLLSTLMLDDFNPRSDFHNTLLFATQFDKNKSPILTRHENLSTTLSDVQQFGDAVVLILEDPNDFFSQRHQQLKNEIDATHQHPNYTPHITIGYKKSPITLSDKTTIQKLFQSVVFRFDQEKSKEFKA